MTPKEIINVVQAFEEGREIEFLRKHTHNDWGTLEKSYWNFDLYDYRVKKIEKELYQYLIYNQLTNAYHATSGFYQNSFDLQSELTSDWKIIQRLSYTRLIIREK